MTVATGTPSTKPKDPGGGTNNKKPESGGGVKPESQVADEAHQPIFGIKSYINQFYDWKLPINYEDTEGWYLIPPATKNRRLVMLFSAATILGLLLLVGGAVAIMVGYVWPRDSVAVALKRHQVTMNENGDWLISAEVISQLAEDKMKHWKLGGLITFALGGVVLAISLLVPSCARMCCHTVLGSDLDSPTEPPIKIYQEDETATCRDGDKSSGPKSPTSKMVPSLEQVTQVQPDEKKLRRTSGSNEDAILMEEK